MSLSALHTLAAVNITSSVGSDVLADGIQRANITKNARQARRRPTDSVFSTYSYITAADPVIEFATAKIAHLLTTIGLKGWKIDDTGGGKNGLEYYWQARDQGGDLQSGSNHMQGIASRGILIPVTIEASLDDEAARLNCRHVLGWDGTNDPIVYTDSQALPGSPAIDESFGLGPVKLNGTEIVGIQSVTIDFGFQVNARRGGGQTKPWPTFVSIISARPTLRIRFLDTAKLATYGFGATKQTATDSVIYLAKWEQGQDRLADATAEHISFTIDEGMFWVEEETSDLEGDQESTLVIAPDYDGTNDALVADYATAIT